jgi:hypothetical protein
MGEKNGISRRKFVKDAAVFSAGANAAFTIVPRHLLGKGMTPPSDLLNVAGVGVGGMGRANLINLSSQNIVALCDVDWGYADKGFDSLPTDIENLQRRIDAPDPQPQPGRPTNMGISLGSGWSNQSRILPFQSESPFRHCARIRLRERYQSRGE